MALNGRTARFYFTTPSCTADDHAGSRLTAGTPQAPTNSPSCKFNAARTAGSILTIVGLGASSPRPIASRDAGRASWGGPRALAWARESAARKPICVHYGPSAARALPNQLPGSTAEQQPEQRARLCAQDTGKFQTITLLETSATAFRRSRSDLGAGAQLRADQAERAAKKTRVGQRRRRRLAVAHVQTRGRRTNDGNWRLALFSITIQCSERSRQSLGASVDSVGRARS